MVWVVGDEEVQVRSGRVVELHSEKQVISGVRMKQ